MQCKVHLNPKWITGELIKQMKLSKLALIAAIACGTYAGNVFADQTNDIQLVSCESDCDCGEPVCGCEPACDDACDAGCDSGCDSAGCGLGLGDCGIASRLRLWRLLPRGPVRSLR